MVENYQKFTPKSHQSKKFCLKITQNVAFVFRNFDNFPLCPIKIDLSGNNVLPQG